MSTGTPKDPADRVPPARLPSEPLHLASVPATVGDLIDSQALFRKRVLDIVLGTLLALVAVPVIAVAAVLCATTLRCNPFFVQRRPGIGTSDVRVIKLRTLPRDFPLEAVKPEAVGAPVPRLCGWLRRRHIDELPQLFEVVAGRMSLVGPRPRLCDAVEPVDATYDRIRRSVRPGCSGLWQISPAGGATATGAPAYDLFYLRNVNVRLDLWILFRTLAQQVGLVGPAELADVPSWARRATSDPIALPDLGALRTIVLDQHQTAEEPRVTAMGDSVG